MTCERAQRLPGSALALAALGAALAAAPATALARHGELPNRIPEGPPYNAAEAQVHPPPWEALWDSQNNPTVCAACHPRIYREWNGSMMANAWRDPAWRGAFLLIARLTSTDGDCDLPDPPDGTAKARINPFANGDCSSTFDLGQGMHTTRGSGSLLDDFCARCHMPANYLDQVPPEGVRQDVQTGVVHGAVRADFDPTSDDGSGIAFATDRERSRNTRPGKIGISCEACHAIAESRRTPFANYAVAESDYVPAIGRGFRAMLVDEGLESLTVPDADSPNLGFGVGAGAYRVSPHALVSLERFGPLTHADYSSQIDPYLSDTFGVELPYTKAAFELAAHRGSYRALFERAELCAQCHDVTNPLTIRNSGGRWVGGFPIERTYTEWRDSRYADRPANPNFDPAFKRDCQGCHMQQDFGRPGTAQALYQDDEPVAPLESALCVGGPVRHIYHSHHFIGGNAFIPRLLGADVDATGEPHAYPELSAYSYSSADKSSAYNNAYWENVSASGPPTHHARLAWDRLRHVLDLEVETESSARPGRRLPLGIRVTNSGSGHKFPTGFPEGRNAWVAVRAWDVGTGKPLLLHDLVWDRTSQGVGWLTTEPEADPSFPDCDWVAPAGSPDPYAHQFRAVASLGDGCPTLDLPYATALNLVTDERGRPIDLEGRVIDRSNPLELPQFRDIDGDGDRFDDAYLVDTRLRPLPHAGASAQIDRYSVLIPDEAVGPVAVTVAVYYQSLEASVARKFLGNLADTDMDHRLEPCVLGGACDGRSPMVEPAVVEGAPPVPMEVRTRVVELEGRSDVREPYLELYPAGGSRDVYADAVVKASFSEPVVGIDATRFTLTDADGVAVPGDVDQIGDFTWALFPRQVFLELGATYTARLEGPLCDAAGNCAGGPVEWSFTVTDMPAGGMGDTRVPIGAPAHVSTAPAEVPATALVLVVGIALGIGPPLVLGLRRLRRT